MPGRASEHGDRAALRDGGRATVETDESRELVMVRKRARTIVERTSAAAAAIGAFAAMAAAGAAGTNPPHALGSGSAQVMFLAQIAHGPGPDAGTRAGVPNAVGAAAKLWLSGRREVALAMIASLVACEQPHALVLWARMHAQTTDPDTARQVGEAYAMAALRGHPGAHLALARNHAGKGADAGNVTAHAHLIEYGWLTGGGALLEEVMGRHVRKLPETQELEAYDEAARWRRLREAPRPRPRCAHTERPS